MGGGANEHIVLNGLVEILRRKTTLLRMTNGLFWCST